MAFQINGEKMNNLISGVGSNWMLDGKKINLNSYLTSYTKINSRRIKDLNINPLKY